MTILFLSETIDTIVNEVVTQYLDLCSDPRSDVTKRKAETFRANLQADLRIMSAGWSLVLGPVGYSIHPGGHMAFWSLPAGDLVSSPWVMGLDSFPGSEPLRWMVRTYKPTDLLNVVSRSEPSDMEAAVDYLRVFAAHTDLV